MRLVISHLVAALVGALGVALLLGSIGSPGDDARSLPVALAGGSCTSQNGDVNADGEVDLSDALSVLMHLFRGSPAELVPLCAPPELTARITELEAQLADAQAELAACQSTPRYALLATGQTTCYDGLPEDIDAEIPCDSTTCPGQDGFYATGCPSEGRFVDNGDGTVTDYCTGLMWQQNNADANGDGRLSNDGSDYIPWCDALSYCENLIFASHDDWRLPNVRELQSIVDYGRRGPALDPVFGELVPGFCWSSTHSARPDSAWGVDLGTGGVFVNGICRGSNCAIGSPFRAVRTAR